MKTKNKVELFLDSGAFSAFSQDVEIDLDEYIAFIKEHKEVLAVYANLDVIGDAEGTMKNQKRMEKAGLEPLPCFHYGEDIRYLEHYLEHYDYVALGGMVPISTKDLAKWLDTLFSDYICDAKGNPKVKIHGFGMTSLKLMLRYPWYSVDSTSWVITGRLGSVYVPRLRGGQYVYGEESWKVCVSSRSPGKGEAGKHIDTLSPAQKGAITDYFAKKGYGLGSSEFASYDTSYELQEDEKWAERKPEEGKRLVEKIIEPGLSNDYKQRDEINIKYFLDLEKTMPEWPWAFKLKTGGGFGL